MNSFDGYLVVYFNKTSLKNISIQEKNSYKVHNNKKNDTEMWTNLCRIKTSKNITFNINF